MSGLHSRMFETVGSFAEIWAEVTSSATWVCCVSATRSNPKACLVLRMLRWM